MTQTHLANTFFESELEQTKTRPLDEWFSLHPIPLQLQFLPLLYRTAGEKLLVTAQPPQPYLDYLKKNNFSIDRIEILSHPTASLELSLWGASRSAAAWAHKHQASLFQPDWERVREVHSKLFAFTASPQMPHARLLQNEEEAQDWLASFSGPKVLKKAFGTAGSGHTHVESTLPPHARKLFTQPVIAEPWVQRHFDFSTQWKIGADIEYIGATHLESTPRGVYLGTRVGEENTLFRDHLGALQEHLDICRPILKKIQALGFFGHLGIDAFVYEWEGKKKLRAMSEINARKTMGWVALQIQRRHFPKSILHMRYEKSSAPGFLPTHLGERVFERQLLLAVE